MKLLDSPPPRTCFKDPEAPAGHSATCSGAIDSNTQCFPTCFEAPEVPARHSATCPEALNSERASRSFAKTGLFLLFLKLIFIVFVVAVFFWVGRGFLKRFGSDFEGLFVNFHVFFLL